MRLVTILFPIWFLLAQTHGEEIPFEHLIIDAGFYGDCKAVGDIDGDGFLDVVVGGGDIAGDSHPHDLYWYKYPAWTKTDIAQGRGTQYTTDMQLGDIDGDGDLDIIIGDGEHGNNVIWFENPRKGNLAKDLWVRHEIGSHGTFAHDVEVGDIDHDGRLDVVVHQGKTSIFLQRGNPKLGPSAWTKVVIGTTSRGGTALGDINRDGRLDIVQNGYWYECPRDPEKKEWIKHDIAAGWPDDVGVTVADINHDGRPDVLLAPAESAGRLVWYEAPPDPKNGQWIEHVIDHDVEYMHTFKAADINQDGHLDVVFAEMAQSTRKRVGFYLNGGNGGSWKLRVLSSKGSHNLRVGDFEGNGIISIVGTNWQGPPVEMWKNKMLPKKVRAKSKKGGAK
jgi:hypothetical protein